MKRTWMIGAALVLIAAVTAGGSMASPTGGDGSGGPIRTSQTPDEAGRMVPDMVAILPGTVQTARRNSSRGMRTLLTFSSSAVNAGAGPLIIRAKRPNRSTSTMTARQVLARSDGSRERGGTAGRLRFIVGGGHSHWHLQGFMRYELRTVFGASLRRDRKTGFCLGDRYDGTGPDRAPGEPASPVYTSNCGLSRPDLTSLTQGISVGYGDDYPALLEGQYVDITGLPTGRYVLALRVDPDGLLLDMHTDNNVSSMLVKIVRSPRSAHARILGWCNSTDSCPTPTGGR
jgi:hypothetical protein